MAVEPSKLINQKENKTLSLKINPQCPKEKNIKCKDKHTSNTSAEEAL